MILEEADELAHRVGALAWADAVHYAPHRRIDVAEVGKRDEVDPFAVHVGPQPLEALPPVEVGFDQDAVAVTACQQVCPSDAIVFGNLNDPESKVSKLVKQQRNYGLLEEIGTRPRTTYLAVVRNPNPALEPKGSRT